MTTATDNQVFDVDKCVNEDGRKCLIVGASPDYEAHYIGPYPNGHNHVVTGGGRGLHHVLAEQIRNIQPRPRTVTMTIYERANGTRFATPDDWDDDERYKHIGTITIDLDKCEQVQPDGVMTPDELHAAGLYVRRLCGGRLVIERPNGHMRWAIGAGWIAPGGEYRATSFDTFAVAYNEATRIVREGLHHA